jgi:N-acetyl-anhydromuramyl-L-alanine amidase AmpD
VEFTEDEDPVQNVKNLQSWSRSEKNWVDIPYHYMIDLDGNIFETRPINIPGDTNTEYDPTGHALVEVMGNYEIQELNEKQLNSMIDLIKYLSERFEVSNENIRTHKDYSKMTVCPGKNIYKYFENGYILRQLSK